ncbi:hypothetical protein JCM10450v2_001238 [Rhodotorula kratochvilovae]
MPSIKACLASFALMALAISPIAQASPVQGNDLVRRSSQPSFYSNEAAVEKRSAESRKQASSRVKKAKLAAAKKAKRASSTQDEGQALLKRHIAELHARDGVTAEHLERRAIFARALRRYRCSTDRVCTRAVTAPTDLPANGAAVCNPTTHLCAVGCQDGFVLTGGECIANQASCGPNACGTVENGAFLCSGNNVCTLVCDTANGYQATPQGTCVSTRTSATNCGAIGNVCPGSYNGVGNPSCRNGFCRLSCPSGTTLRRTLDGSALYCYGA